MVLYCQDQLKLDSYDGDVSFLLQIQKFYHPEERLMDASQLRLLAWQAIEDFPDLAEPKSRLLSGMIIDFSE